MKKNEIPLKDHVFATQMIAGFDESVYLYAQDITARKTAQNKMEKANRELSANEKKLRVMLLDLQKAQGYKSPSQIARVLTEDWGARNLFCTSCRRSRLEAASNNTAVFDFVCDSCSETYQLKSQRIPIGNKVIDAAYEPMITSIKENKTPNLLFLHYNAENYGIENLILVPRFFISASCIEARKPLSRNARRAGWRGCYIVLRQLPIDGRISIIRERGSVRPDVVRRQYNRFKFLSGKRDELRGWTADVLKVIRELGKKDFSLEEAYAFEPCLQKLHPANRHVRPKIRQQLQMLRDKGILKFTGKGRYSFTEMNRIR